MVGGNPAQAWINGSLALRVIGHELGHNFGLYHSHALECGATTLGNSCASLEYGDMLDIMGTSSWHISAFQKERLGWLNDGASPPVITADASGTYWLDVYESTSAGPKALKILKSKAPATGAKTWYYLETRRGIGFDSDLAMDSNVLTGVVLHLGTDLNANSSNLLDMTPDTVSWYDPALEVGKTFTDPDAGVTLFPTGVDASGATVNVSFGSSVCVPANPIVALSPSDTQWVQPGNTVTYTVTVTNKDNGGCSASSFNLQASAPAGWTAAFEASPLTLSPGTSGSTSFTAPAPAVAADGFYTVSGTATNSAQTSYAGWAAVTESFVTALTLQVGSEQASYSPPAGATLTATVTVGSAPAEGSSVTFIITKPDQSVITESTATGANGFAVFNFRLKPRDPSGLWQVQAVATVNGFSGTSTTSFMVQ